MDADRAKPPIEPDAEPDTTDAGEPDASAGADAPEDRSPLIEDDGVEDTPV